MDIILLNGLVKDIMSFLGPLTGEERQHAHVALGDEGDDGGLITLQVLPGTTAGCRANAPLQKCICRLRV